MRHPSNRAGFGWLEALVGFALLSCLIASFLDLLGATIDAQGRVNEMERAEQLAIEAVIQSRQLPASQVEDRLDGRQLQTEDGYSVCFEVLPADSSTVVANVTCLAVTIRVCRQGSEILRFNLFRSDGLE